MRIHLGFLLEFKPLTKSELSINPFWKLALGEKLINRENCLGLFSMKWVNIGERSGKQDKIVIDHYLQLKILILFTWSCPRWRWHSFYRLRSCGIEEQVADSFIPCHLILGMLNQIGTELPGRWKLLFGPLLFCHLKFWNGQLEGPPSILLQFVTVDTHRGVWTRWRCRLGDYICIHPQVDNSQ